MQSVIKKWLNELPTSDVLANFSNCKSDFERTDFIYNLFETVHPDLFVFPFGKNCALSNELREIGNDRYKNVKLYEALIFYTKSLAYAPAESKEYALALGNRSACLIAMGAFDKAIRDVKSALKVTDIDDTYRAKLKKRHEECEKKSVDYSEDNDEINLPTLPTQNYYFSCATSTIQLAENEKYGRHIIANECINTGEVLMIEKPYASVLVPECYFTNCSYCYKHCLCLIPCDICVTSLFCSRNCLEESKYKFHDVECALLERLVALSLGKLDLLALRILIISSNKGVELGKLKETIDNHSNSMNPEKYQSTDFLRVYDLVGNEAKRSDMDLFQRSFIAITMVSALRKFTSFFNEKPELDRFAGAVLLHFLQNLPCNAHEISEARNGEIKEVASAAYATFSLLNHACDPNVVRHCIGDQVILRAIRPIKTGEELLDNYGYHYATHSKKERQSGLGQYYFTCECEACLLEWPQYHDLPSDTPLFHRTDLNVSNAYSKLHSEFEEKLQMIFDNKITVEILDFLCYYLDFLDGNVKRPWQDYNKCQEAIKHCFQYFPDYSRKK